MTSSRRPLVVIGAAGQMTSVAVRLLAQYDPRWKFVLCDVNERALHALTVDVQKTAPAKAVRVDLYEAGCLRDVIRGAAFVLHGAGPFHKTAKRVRSACLLERAAYVDIDDDVESSQEAVALHADAAAAGVPLYVGCGASPGFTNVLARDVIEQLDSVESIEVAWCVGDEGPQDFGRAVVEHVMHIGAGPCVTWRNGGPVTTETFAASRIFPFGTPLGDYRVYEVAHPETIHLPRSYPVLQSAICWGGLHPASINGIIRGVALACHEGRLTLDEGVRFFQAINRDEFGSWKGWREAWRGMRAQNHRGEVSLSETLHFMANALRGKHEQPRSGIGALATGLKDGRRVAVVRTSAPTRPGSFWQLMPTCTGGAAAAILSLAADRVSPPGGTWFPEQWIEPESLYRRIARFGSSVADVIAPTYRVRELGPGHDRGTHPVPANTPVPANWNAANVRVPR